MLWGDYSLSPGTFPIPLSRLSLYLLITFDITFNCYINVVEEKH